MYVAITGTIAAGKGEIVKILQRRGFVHYGFGDMLREELSRSGVTPTREATQKYANEQRATHGHGFLAKILVARMEKDTPKNAVFESVRHPAELALLRRLPKFVLISVDAPRDVRYERLTSRGRNEGIGSYEEFCRLEDAELEGSGAGQQILAVMGEADVKIVNNGSLEELEQQVREALNI
jgi:dephospho-CoA kinase